MRCPERTCQAKLIQLPIKLEGSTSKVWSHPDTLQTCPYKFDGIRMEISIIDPIICSKFQELLEEKIGFKGRIINALKKLARH